MNKLIQELLIQSEVFNKDGTVLKDVTGYELNKFAELVVRECARVASDYDGAHYVGTAIEKHFGVKE
jgi:hypothetical protein